MLSVWRVPVSLLSAVCVISCAQSPLPEESDADIDDVEVPDAAIIDPSDDDDDDQVVRPDAGQPQDAGEAARDAAVRDAAPMDGKPDAETPREAEDAGVAPPVDSGGPVVPPPRDAAMPVDSGTEVKDAAPQAVDSATPPPPPPQDAGPSDAGPVDSGGRDAGLACIPGVYAGAFSGEISALLGFIRIDISGTISIEVGPEEGAQQLQIKNGKLEGNDQDGNPIRAVVTGTLNCATRRLENGRIDNGTYRRKDPILQGPERTVGFTGTTTGIYNHNPPSASGQWEVVNESGLRSGSGNFSTTLQR
jgi:hypothetical protein